MKNDKDKNTFSGSSTQDNRQFCFYRASIFFRDGFWESLTNRELLLYLFLILVADRNGVSYYSYDKIYSLLRISMDEYLNARNALIDKNLIAFDGYFSQVFSLPEKLANKPLRLLKSQQQMEKYDPATICNLIGQSLKGD